MTTVADRNVRLEWDAFFDEGKAGLTNMRQHIDAFRKMEWPPIVRTLSQEYGIAVPAGIEPHWVTPGKAVYWQHDVVQKAAWKRQDSGGMEREVEVVDRGWVSTNPLPANNASVVAGYLRKGFRLRPPEDGVDDEVSESAALTVEPQSQPPQGRVFYCGRHSKPRQFANWRAYLRHCQRFQEGIDEKPPLGLKLRIKKFTWYCFLHNIGFNNKRLVTLHVRQELRRPARGVHPDLEQMEVQRG